MDWTAGSLLGIVIASQHRHRPDCTYYCQSQPAHPFWWPESTIPHSLYPTLLYTCSTILPILHTTLQSLRYSLSLQKSPCTTHTVYTSLGVSLALFTQHSEYHSYCLHNTQCTTRIVYTTLSVPFTLFTKLLVYHSHCLHSTQCTTHCLHNTQCTIHTVYTTLSVPLTLFTQHSGNYYIYTTSSGFSQCLHNGQYTTMFT